jgi:hypothetical protein
MIRHEDIGVNLPARLGASLAQRLNEALAIRIVHENPRRAVRDSGSNRVLPIFLPIFNLRGLFTG